MNSKLTRNAAQKKINLFFVNEKLIPNEVKKIKKIAMAHRIRLGEYRKRFCKECYADLKIGKVRVSSKFKHINCPSCKSINKWKI